MQKKDLYIDDLAEETGNLFEYWASLSLDMDKMVTNYMNSVLRENIDKRNAKYCTQMWYDMDEQFTKVHSSLKYDSILCEWLGYFYTYIQGVLKKGSNYIIKRFPFLLMYRKAGVLHDLDISVAINKVLG
jgi:hypothetical protein